MEKFEEKNRKYQINETEKASLIKEMTFLLQEYEYNPTNYGCTRIINAWVSSKGWLINLFKKHPNYNGKYQIVFDTDYNRKIDKDMIYKFQLWIRELTPVPSMAMEINNEKEATIDVVKRLLTIDSGSFEYKEDKSRCGKYHDYYYDFNGYFDDDYFYKGNKNEKLTEYTGVCLYVYWEKNNKTYDDFIESTTEEKAWCEFFMKNSDVCFEDVFDYDVEFY